MRTVIALKRNGEKIAQSELDNWDQMKTEKAYQEYKSKRKEKPWLKTVRQSVPASPAYRDLCRYAGVQVKEPEEFHESEKEVELIEFPTIERDKSKVWSYNGQEFTTNQLAKKVGVDRKVITQRLRKGWTIRHILKHGGVI
ncbi:hypothetical protein [Staphylococcus agnetis]|uniref:hypothetical protein n=1 Tax=Staphylococcus agnetis TaxID=985762 RepID=UPI0004E2C0AE|nr:hypothetical protein [Staphylococcus agnetis]KFE41949.1 hypothetical protein SAGN_05990 [Staphylococcus agnetis]NJH66039.1 hypothetical protein [Staphylococcus agnetis]NJH98081.1 hypothetical protein [Staphylococcus agnetis]PTH45897.1 hypothetical protein BU587_09865 [Staphylococcus agnetis]PTH71541.1 hypothetical protein BU581_11795 [Staphylococcus agnetis]